MYFLIQAWNFNTLYNLWGKAIVSLSTHSLQDENVTWSWFECILMTAHHTISNLCNTTEVERPHRNNCLWTLFTSRVWLEGAYNTLTVPIYMGHFNDLPQNKNNWKLCPWHWCILGDLLWNLIRPFVSIMRAMKFEKVLQLSLEIQFLPFSVYNTDGNSRRGSAFTAGFSFCI